MFILYCNSLAILTLEKISTLSLYKVRRLTQKKGPHNRTTATGEAYLFFCFSKIKVVGVGGIDTGLGLFILKAIPRNAFICSHAPTASLRTTTQDGDYAEVINICQR